MIEKDRNTIPNRKALSCSWIEERFLRMAALVRRGGHFQRIMGDRIAEHR